LSCLFLGLGAVALLVGAVGVANIIIISLCASRSEIGLRRTLGVTKGQVRVQFLSEAILLALTGPLPAIRAPPGSSQPRRCAWYEQGCVTVPLPSLAGSLRLGTSSRDSKLVLTIDAPAGERLTPHPRRSRRRRRPKSEAMSSPPHRGQS
jgi:putative ABC transport system permease protein